jgi:RHS repeat-associated protein
LLRAAAALVALAVCLDAPDGDRGRWRVSLASAACPTGSSQDSISIYPPQRLTHYGSSSVWNLYDDSFTADTVTGWRYVVELVKAGVTNAIVDVNGKQFVGSSDLTGGRIFRAIDVAPGENSLGIAVKGSNGSWMDVRIVRVKDPTFTVLGDTTLARAGAPIVHTVAFSFPTITDSAMCTLRAINGLQNGAHRITSGTLIVNGIQVLSSSDFGTGKAVITRQVMLYPTDSLRFYNQNDTSQVTLRFRQTDATAPVVTLTSPAVDTLLTTASFVRVTGTVTDETPGWLRVNSRPPFPTPGAFNDSIPLPVDGHYVLSIQTINSSCLSTTLTRHVYRDTHAPSLTVLSPAADTTVTDSLLHIVGTWLDTTRTVVTVDGVTAATAISGGSFDYVYPIDFGPNRVIVRAVDALGFKTEVMRVVLRKLPSDDAISGPTPSALSATEVTAFLPSVQFLYTGAGHVQTGAVTDSFKADRASVLRGRVLARDYGPIPNVLVRILNHPEYGQTLTRADGQFDLVVNGGGQLVVRMTKLGYLEAQRQINPVVNTYCTLDDVGMIGRSAKFTVVDLESEQVLRSRFATDANGDREIRLYFPGGVGTRAKVSTSPPDSAEFRYVRVRATEYTQGGQGLSAMPAMLPPSSAYTYCVELSLDEADSLAASARFTKFVSCYVRNFLAYPVGTRVPFGYFDRVTGQWVAENDGVVLKIVGASGDTALVDSNGDTFADSTTVLDGLAITGAERRVLLAEYGLNGVLMRARLNHFSPGDLNPNAGRRQDELPGWPQRLVQLLKLLFGPCFSHGSIIECENRVLGERLPVAGTPYTLNYRSFRASGDSAVRTVSVPVIGNTIPDSLDHIYVLLEAAGKVYRREFPRADITAGKIVSMTWDGLDVYGRRIEGSANAQVSLGYRYNSRVQQGSGGRGFGNPAKSGTGDLPVTGDRAVPRVSWRRQTIVLGASGTGSDGLGGWTISPHHVFDPIGRGTVYYGSGEVDPGDRVPMSRWVSSQWYPGQGNASCPESDGILDMSNGIRPAALVVAPDGTRYFANGCNSSVYRVGTDGIAHRVAGNGVSGPFNASYDGGPAVSAKFTNIIDIALGPDGSLYVASDWGGVPYEATVICRVLPNGTLRRIIGDGLQHQFGGGDEGPVGLATTVEVTSLAVGPDGSLFFSEFGTKPNNQGGYTKIRRVGTDGTIAAYAGSEWCQSSSDSSGQAVRRCIGSVDDLGVDAGGTLYILEGTNGRLRKVSPEGWISTCFSVQNSQFRPNSMSFAPDGSIYVACGRGPINPAHGVYRFDPDGNLAIIGGGVTTGTTYNGAPVATTPLPDADLIATLPDGSYWLVGTGQGTWYVAQRFATDLGNEWMVPTRDGSEVSYFSKTGRHLRTRDALTGAILHSFDYDATYGDLAAIHDVDGRTTSIVRNATTRVPEKVRAPDDQETVLTLTSGLLTRIVDPGGNVTSLAYSTGGLLDSLTDANNHRSTFAWGSDGRLNRDTDAATGYQDLANSSVVSRLRTTRRRTALGRETKYEVTSRDDGTTLRVVTSPAGKVTTMNDTLHNRVETVLPDGTVVTDSISGDPRFGIVAPVPAGTRVRLPSGLTRTLQASRPYNAVTFNPPTAATSSWIEETLLNGSDTLHTEFDLANRRLTIQRSLARRTTVTVDGEGRPIAVHVPGLDTLRQVYLSGRLTEVWQGNRGWRLSYDSRGRLAVLRDTLGRMTTFGYDNADRLTSQTLPGGRQIAFGFDPAGNLTTITPPGRPPHGFDYSTVNLTSRYRPPGAGLTDSLTEYVFNLDRQLTDVLRPDGADVTLAYGSTTGRIDRVTTPRGDANFTYDGSGRLSTLSSPDGATLTYGYDGSIDTVETWSGAVSGNVSVALDRDFRVSSQRVNGGNTAVYAYDRDGLVTQAGALTITRSAANGLITGTALATSILASAESCNSFGEPEFSVALNGADTLWRAHYSRDALGRITAISENVLGTVIAWEYAYSDTGFLKRVTVDGVVSERYGYDGNGNRLRFDAPGDSATGLYDNQDRLVRYGDTRYTYTPVGELQKKVAGADTTRYTYDPLGNLVKVRFQSGDSIDYLIDGRNRRLARKLNGTVTHKWLYHDQLEPVAEMDGAGNVTRYVYGTRSYVPDYLVKSGAMYRIIADQHGSVRLVVNAGDGTIAQRLDYDAYGKITNDSNPGFQCFGYAGGLLDTATGLVRFGARDYDAVLGRWLARDPIGFNSARTNLFAYVSNDPVNRLDPTGLQEDLNNQVLACIQSILAAIGTADPTGAADAINATLYAVQGNWAYAAVSAFAIVPYLGDAGKALQIAATARKATETATDVVKAAKSIEAGNDAWKLVAAHAEGATAHNFKNGVSIQETFRNVDTGQEITRHMIVRGDDVLHGPHFRPFAK